MLYRDELAGFFANLDRPGAEGDRQFYLECWNGNGRFIVDRVGRGTTWVEGLCLSIIGTLQPGPLERYLQGAIARGGEADGLIQRFQLLVYPDPIPEWSFVDTKPDAMTLERVCKVVRALVSTGDMIDKDGHGKPMVYQFSPGAQEMFAEWLTDLQTVRVRNPDETGAMVSHLSKYAGLIPRLALVLKVCDSLASGCAVGAVDEKSLARAILWGEYLESHARRIYELADSPDETKAKLLLKRIRANDLGDRFNRREVRRKGWSGLKNQSDVDGAVTVLIEHGWLRARLSQSEINGRQSEHLLVNPRAFEGAS
jgi:putative DNA primase/helicase